MARFDLWLLALGIALLGVTAVSAHETKKETPINPAVKSGGIEPSFALKTKKRASTLDRGKLLVEMPLKNVIKLSGDRRTGKSENPASSNRDGKRVRPGFINWHDNFEHATVASGKSGKPVLLFQLLGQLDREYT